MRSGNWRGVTLALGLACGLTLVALDSGTARAQVHTIPRLIPAVDINTGGPYYAPPIPYGHYAGKNLVGRCSARARGLCSGLLGHGMGLCKLCGGKGCLLCGGKGLGHGHGDGGAYDGIPDGAILADGGHGHGHGAGPGTVLCGGGGHAHRHGHDPGFATTDVHATGQGMPATQVIVTDPCGEPGCRIGGKHRHLGCKLCGGKGCGRCGAADPCRFCGGKGCGLCGHGGLGNLCKYCGGLCGGLCAKARGLAGHMLGRDKIDWFVGPGGPVPLTPGYTPYVNVTRSPRDFLAFPPFVP